MQILPCEAIERRITGRFFDGIMARYHIRKPTQGYMSIRGDIFFVTSEKKTNRSPRRYTVRILRKDGIPLVMKKDGTIGSGEDFGLYDKPGEAKLKARWYAAQNHNP